MREGWLEPICALWTARCGAGLGSASSIRFWMCLATGQCYRNCTAQSGVGYKEQKRSHLPGVPWRPSCLVGLEILEGPVGKRGHLEAMVGQGSQRS